VLTKYANTNRFLTYLMSLASNRSALLVQHQCDAGSEALSSQTLVADRWYFIDGTKGVLVRRHYVDSALVAQKIQNSATVDEATISLRLGSQRAMHVYLPDGAPDDMREDSCARTPSESATLGTP
jgi:hypothetical protein